MWCFVFQAEDGIRDLVRSRGLGDVYKRQQATYDAIGDQAGAAVVLNPNNGEVLALVSRPSFDPNWFVLGITDDQWAQPVSYTHLTLPTSDLV